MAEILPIKPSKHRAGSASAEHTRVVLKPHFIALVFLGGAAGTAARETLGQLIPTAAGLPLSTLVINVSGAFVLGVLLETLSHLGSDTGWRRTARVIAGAGFLGGFTTYSTLAVDTSTLLGSSMPWLGVAYSLGTLLAGAAASWVGILVGSLTRRRFRARQQMPQATP